MREKLSPNHTHIPRISQLNARRPFMERATRFELATPSLGSLYSTTELCPLFKKNKLLHMICYVNIFK